MRFVYFEFLITVKKALVLKYNGVDVDPEVLLEVVNKYGGIDLVRKNKKWQLISGGLNISSGSNVSRLPCKSV